MTVQSLLSPALPLRLGDTVEDALVRLASAGLRHLPVVDARGQLVAVLGEAALLAYPETDARLSDLPLSPLPPVSAPPDTHVFDAAHLLRGHDLGALPIATDEGDYVGLVVRQAVFGQLAHMLATEEPGTILVADVDRRDFSLAQLAHLVEQSGVRILSASTEDDPGAGRVLVTLKLNVTDTARVRHLLAHHEIRVVGVFDEAESDLEARAAEFLRYLDV